MSSDIAESSFLFVLFCKFDLKVFQIFLFCFFLEGNEDAMVMRRHSISCPSLSVVIKRRSQKSCGGNGGRYRKDLQGLNVEFEPFELAE